jgi:hypothetical protein
LLMVRRTGRGLKSLHCHVIIAPLPESSARVPLERGGRYHAKSDRPARLLEKVNTGNQLP